MFASRVSPGVLSDTERADHPADHGRPLGRLRRLDVQRLEHAQAHLRGEEEVERRFGIHLGVEPFVVPDPPVDRGPLVELRGHDLVQETPSVVVDAGRRRALDDQRTEILTCAVVAALWANQSARVRSS